MSATVMTSCWTVRLQSWQVEELLLINDVRPNRAAGQQQARAMLSRVWLLPGGLWMLRFYRGQEGMLSWALHRLTGLGVLLFLFIHIADIYVVRYGAEAFDDLLFIYKNPFFRVMEILLVGAVFYHAINGLRVILIDFWDGAFAYQKQLFWAVVILFFASFIPVAILMIAAMF